MYTVDRCERIYMLFLKIIMTGYIIINQALFGGASLLGIYANFLGPWGSLWIRYLRHVVSRRYAAHRLGAISVRYSGVDTCEQFIFDLNVTKIYYVFINK